MIRHILSKLGHIVKSRQYEIFLGSCMILVSVISYNLGQINSLKKTPIKIEQGTANIYKTIEDSNKTSPKQTNKPEPKKLDTRVVASKNSDKYHYSWCSGGKRIKLENQIWFASAQEAEAKGLVLAGNCVK